MNNSIEIIQRVCNIQHMAEKPKRSCINSFLFLMRDKQSFFAWSVFLPQIIDEINPNELIFHDKYIASSFDVLIKIVLWCFREKKRNNICLIVHHPSRQKINQICEILLQTICKELAIVDLCF